MNETLKDNQLSEKPSKWKVFLRRSLSTVLLWGIVLSPGFLHPHPLGDYIFLLLMILLSTLGLMEFYRMAERKGLHSYRGMAISFGIILLTSTFFYLTEHWGRSAAPSRASDFECGILGRLLWRQGGDREKSFCGLYTVLCVAAGGFCHTKENQRTARKGQGRMAKLCPARKGL